MVGWGEQTKDIHLVLLIGEGTSGGSILGVKTRKLHEDGTSIFAFAAVELLHLHCKVNLKEVALVVVAGRDDRPNIMSVGSTP